MFQPPDFTLLRRLAWGLAGLLGFFWIAYEDQELTALSFVAAAIAFASGLTVLNRWVGSGKLPRRKWLLSTASVGLIAGAAVGPLTALLMLVKLGLHAHPDADFGLDQFVQALSRTPYWAGLGVLIGLALGFTVRETRD
jgi:MFS family permease